MLRTAPELKYRTGLWEKCNSPQSFRIYPEQQSCAAWTLNVWTRSHDPVPARTPRRMFFFPTYVTSF